MPPIRTTPAGPGGAAIVHRDRLIHAKGYGLRDVEEKLPVDADTLFAIGSATKAFTALGVALLVHDMLCQTCALPPMIAKILRTDRGTPAETERTRRYRLESTAVARACSSGSMRSRRSAIGLPALPPRVAYHLKEKPGRFPAPWPRRRIIQACIP